MIYFIQNTGSEAIRIGSSANPQKMRAELQWAHHDLLILLGTLPGGRKEKKRLHEQFASYRLRGDWFKGDDLLAKIQRLRLRPGTSITVWEECERRGRCRYGLRGVTVAVLGIEEGVFKIHSSWWDRDQKLRLTLYPADGPAPRTIYRNQEEDQRENVEGLVVVCVADIVGTEWPLGTRRDVPAERCLLLSQWPAV